jgi:hypothetical protein
MKPETFFGGIFQFTFHEAKDIIGSLVHETGYWLADFTYYDADVYEDPAPSPVREPTVTKVARYSLIGKAIDKSTYTIHDCWL